MFLGCFVIDSLLVMYPKSMWDKGREKDGDSKGGHNHDEQDQHDGDDADGDGDEDDDDDNDDDEVTQNIDKYQTSSGFQSGFNARAL